MLKLVLATTNNGKVIEIKEKLKDYILTIESLHDYPAIPEIEENGKTFLENASIKANTVLRYTNLPVLADDSGLKIDFLDGKPGVYSSRWGITDQERIERVLKELKDTTEKQRRAHFVCAMSFVTPEGKSYNTEGICSGKITLQPMGKNGFGYDPIFIPDGYDLTFSQLGKDVKNKISHRAIALEKMISRIVDYYHLKSRIIDE